MDACPICQKPNACTRACSEEAASCWCFSIKLPQEVIECLKASEVSYSCLCRACLTELSAVSQAVSPRQALDRVMAKYGNQPDSYMENGYLVFTAAYHLKRGYCCGNGCRHCPYPAKT